MARSQETREIVADIIALLNRQGVLPERLRQMAWQRLLGLPGNSEAFASLAARGTHEVCAKFSAVCPYKGVVAMRVRHLISALAHWCPRLAVMSYLPGLAFPVTQVFRADHLSAFEFMVTFFMTWAHDWLDSFPGPPVVMLSRAVALLKHADEELYRHFQKFFSDVHDVDGLIGITVIWPLLQCLLSDCMPDFQWLALWDFIVARAKQPDLLMAVAVALLRQRRSLFLAVTETNLKLIDVELHRSRECSSVRALIKHAEALLSERANLNSMPDIERNAYVLPLPKAISYPLLNIPCSVNPLADLSSRVELSGAFEKRQLGQKLQEAKRHLGEAVAQLEEQRIDCTQELNERQTLAVEEIVRLSGKRDQAENHMRALQTECTDRLRAGVDEISQRQRSAHDRALSTIADELRIRSERRALDVEQMRKWQSALESEERVAHAVTERLREQRVEIESEHVQKIKDMHSKQCDLLGELRMQQLDTESRCAQIQAEVARTTQHEQVRLRELAETRRTAEVDVYLQGLLREFELGKHMLDGKLIQVKEMSDHLEDDALRLQERRQNLAKIDNARALAKEAVGWQAHERARSGLWSVDQNQYNQEELFRRHVEDDAFLSSARLMAKSRIWNKVTKDAKAAQVEEDEFREALLGLDGIRKARLAERSGLVWE